MRREYGRWIPVVLCAWAVAGCYRYVPAEMEATPPGTDVRLLVTREGALEMEEVGALDGNQEPRVDGTVVATEDAALLIRVPIAQRQDGFIVSRIDQSVRVPMEEVVSFQRRELNKLGTGLLLTGGALALGALVAVIAEPLGGDDGDPDTPPDELFTLQIFSIPFGR